MTATDIGTARQRLRAVGAPAAVAAGAAGLALAVHLRDPHVAGSWGVCPVYALTGGYCPACGGLRAAHDLTDLHFGAALASNPLIYLVVALAGWAWLYWFGRRVGLRIPALPTSRWIWITTGIAVAVWTVARNLPGSALAP